LSIEYTEIQLDALRELANIASGTAATALSTMLGREIELSVPHALAVPLADAVEEAGPADAFVTGVVIPIQGQLSGFVLLLFGGREANTICELLGVEPGTEVGESALGEIGNILGAAYINALSAVTGLEMLPEPPQLAADLLGAIVASLFSEVAADQNSAFVMDTQLEVAGAPCSFSFLLLPTSGGVEELLAPLGLGDPAA
jgi:chemotaxis protein CheC